MRNREIPPPFMPSRPIEDNASLASYDNVQNSLLNLIRDKILDNKPDSEIISIIKECDYIKSEIAYLAVYNCRDALVNFLWSNGNLDNNDLSRMLMLSFGQFSIEISKFILSLNIVQYNIDDLVNNAIRSYHMYKMDDLSTSKGIIFFEWILKEGYPKEKLPKNLLKEVEERLTMDMLSNSFQDLCTQGK